MRRLALLLLLLPLSGCGTVLFGLSEDRQVQLVTEPAGARVWVNGAPLEERTPCVLTLESGVEHVVEARLEDHAGVLTHRGQTRSVPLIQPWRALGDYLLPLGSLWVTIDYLTGALHEFRRERILLELRAVRVSPETATSEAPPPGPAPRPGCPPG